jgi:hypothetical protein
VCADSDLTFAQGERGDFLGVSTSVAGLRRRELLGTGAGSLAAAICDSCGEHARQLLRSKAAGDLLVEVRRVSEHRLCCVGHAPAAGNFFGSSDLQKKHDVVGCRNRR